VTHLKIVSVALAACIAALLASSPAPASANNADGALITFSDTYNKLLAAFPSGYADACEMSVVLHPRDGGFCDTQIDRTYFYPDGTLGARPWVTDPTSPTGWAAQPDPCDGLTNQHYHLWAAYVDYASGYLDFGPELTLQQIDQYAACWGWWF
jgi:hypothetical protein